MERNPHQTIFGSTRITSFILAVIIAILASVLARLGIKPPPATHSTNSSISNNTNSTIINDTHSLHPYRPIPNVRPQPSKRTFASTKVDDFLERILPPSKFRDEDGLGRLFVNCLPNTLDTTVYHHPSSSSPSSSSLSLEKDDDDSFVITGDIPAMWLRDSMNQVMPYLFFLLPNKKNDNVVKEDDSALRDLICGLIRRQSRSILMDPYANAFNFNESATTPIESMWQNDTRIPPMTPPVFEGKYELDSLLSLLKLSTSYWNATTTRSLMDASCFIFHDDDNDDKILVVEDDNNGGLGPISPEWFHPPDNRNNQSRTTVMTWFASIQRTLDVLEYNTHGATTTTTTTTSSSSSSFSSVEWYYTFSRFTDTSTDTLFRSADASLGRKNTGGGVGPPAAISTGLSRSYFRPSDDAQMLPFHVPSNFMMVVELYRLVGMLDDMILLARNARKEEKEDGDGKLTSLDEDQREELKRLSSRAKNLAIGAEDGLWKYAVIHPCNSNSKPYLAYEIDGYGNQLFMDDANIPSLLSLPHLGVLDSLPPDRPNADTYDWVSIYDETRRRVLSPETNPYFFIGQQQKQQQQERPSSSSPYINNNTNANNKKDNFVEGIGGPHVGYNMIWPMSIIIRAMTSKDDDEIRMCLEWIVRSSVRTGLLHESFDKDDMTVYTREWFAWVNGLFGMLILKLWEERPYLILKDEFLNDE